MKLFITILFYFIIAPTFGQDLSAASKKGNEAYNKNEYGEAIDQYNLIIANSKDKMIVADANYNKGLAYVKQKKMAEAADAFKKSLRLKPVDNETRENLQKVLNELANKKKQEEKKQDKPNNKQDDKKNDKPKPNPQEPKLSNEKMEDVFKRLQQTEKSVQQQQQQKNTPAYKNGKDW